MDKKTILWIIIAILAILTIYVLFFQGSSSSTVVTAGQSAGQASSAMVGGC